MMRLPSSFAGWPAAQSPLGGCLHGQLCGDSPLVSDTAHPLIPLHLCCSSGEQAGFHPHSAGSSSFSEQCSPRSARPSPHRCPIHLHTGVPPQRRRTWTCCVPWQAHCYHVKKPCSYCLHFKNFSVNVVNKESCSFCSKCAFSTGDINNKIQMNVCFLLSPTV